MATLTIPQLVPDTQAAPAPFSRLVRVELRKSWDTRASFWLLVAIGALVFLAELITAIVAGLHSNTTDINWGTFTAVAAFITGLLLPVLGIMLVSSEWSQRTGMVTFALEPRRGLVVAAKLIVGLILTLITVVFAIALGAAFNLLYGAIAGHISWSFGVADALVFTVTQMFSMIGGFALACLFLNTPASIVVYFAYKFAVPVLFGIGGELIGWFRTFSRWIDFQMAQNQLYDRPISSSDWAHLVTSGFLWLILPLGFGIWRILRAELK